MKLNISKETFDPRWFEMEDKCKLKIRPYAIGQSDLVFKDGEVIQTGEQNWKMFEYSLVAWEGVFDDEGNPLELTDKVKRLVFDYALGDIVTFVLLKNNEMLRERQEQEKN